MISRSTLEEALLAVLEQYNVDDPDMLLGDLIDAVGGCTEVYDEEGEDEFGLDEA